VRAVVQLVYTGCARERPPPRQERAVVAASMLACSCLVRLARTCEEACGKQE
jgi:hypothetical protein